MKHTKEQFKEDYNRAFHLLEELEHVMDTISFDIQFCRIPNEGMEKALEPIQLRLLRKLTDSRQSSFKRTIDGLIVELKQIKENRCGI